MYNSLSYAILRRTSVFAPIFLLHIRYINMADNIIVYGNILPNQKPGVVGNLCQKREEEREEIEFKKNFLCGFSSREIILKKENLITGKPSNFHTNCGGGFPVATHFNETVGPGCRVCSENQYNSSGVASVRKRKWLGWKKYLKWVSSSNGKTSNRINFSKECYDTDLPIVIQLLIEFAPTHSKRNTDTSPGPPSVFSSLLF